MEVEWVNGLVIFRLKKYILVLTKEEWMKAVKRGKGIKRREAEEKRLKKDVDFQKTRPYC
jgi:hypothetical protein